MTTCVRGSCLSRPPSRGRILQVAFLPARILTTTFLPTLILMSWMPISAGGQETGRSTALIRLPDVAHDGAVSVERALTHRRSIRELTSEPLTAIQLSQLLWAGQGITEAREAPPAGFDWQWMGGLRTAPSAGGLYPLELYVVLGRACGDIFPGLYRYEPRQHGLVRMASGDLRGSLHDAALRQASVRTAPVSFVIAAVIEGTAAKYGDRAERYVHIEVGAAAENIYLQAESLGLGTVFMGAFQDDAVARALGIPGGQRVFGIMPIGHASRD